MDAKKFSLICNSLRQYRRAELKDFEDALGASAIDTLYVDPLPLNAVLNQVLAPTTTFLLGRKGTGKSTVFAKAQADIRLGTKNISVYLDVKAVYDLISANDVPITKDLDVSPDILRAHYLRKEFLGAIIADILKELRLQAKGLPLWDKVLGRKRILNETIRKMEQLEGDIKKGMLAEAEIPILQTITKKRKEESKVVEQKTSYADLKLAIQNGTDVAISAKDFEEILSDSDMYEEYSDAILRSFPFSSLLDQIKIYLYELGRNRLYIFFDDFSEITFIDQKLFVDVILAPLNNSSDRAELS